VRIPIAWALVEPEPGSFDRAALERVRQIVGWAGQAGLLVVLDMHQYEWSPCFGGNGMPAWATSPCPAVATGAPALAEAAPAETRFWQSRSLQLDFAAAWAKVASAVGSPPCLLGYDILNEPPAGLIPPGVFETEVLPPFYRLVGSALRKVNRRALLFVEPALTHSAASPASSFLGPIGLARVVYAPHEYGSAFDDASGDVGDFAGPAQFAPDLAVVRAQARRMGAALWVGEWGDVNTASPASYRPSSYVPDMLAAQDAAMVGSAYWTYWRHGWPYTATVAAQLTRITPFAIAGVPDKIATGTSSASLEWTSSGGTTLVSLPAGSDPAVQVISGPVRWRRLGSGWLALEAPAGVTASVQLG
jgi:endoglycosylceramidase